MAIIPLPTNFSFTNVSKFGLDRATNVLRSRYTGQTQRVVYPYAVWVFEGTLVSYDGANAAAIRSFFLKLEGQKNSFRLPVPGAPLPLSGFGANMPVSVAALVRATAITVANAAFANLSYLAEGDYITIQDELKIVTAIANLDATGTTTINFMPPLRAAVAVGIYVISLNPTMLMTATDDKVGNWGITPPNRHALKLSGIENVG